MRLLMITTGFPPYLFSENICNGKLVMALKAAGIEVDVITKCDEGPAYGNSEWTEPWSSLKDNTDIVTYPVGNPLIRVFDVVRSSLTLGCRPSAGVRWARRAYRKALQLLSERHYDAVLTRSPTDISHLIGLKLKKKTGIRWIANWNDPASPIWPGQYKHLYSERRQKSEMALAWRLLKNADVNTFPSDSLRQHFIANFPELENLHTEVIPHIGLLDDLWPKSGIKKTDCKLRLLHSGNLSSERNPETTFMAMRRLVEEGYKNFEFHIMGNINDYTQDLIKQYGLEENVKCIGSFTYMEALKKMQEYDVLVLVEALLEKGIFFASKFTDYLQTGLPILAISPRAGFAADMLRGQNGEYLADNKDVHSIYESMKKIVGKYETGTLKECASGELYSFVSPDKVVKQYRDLTCRK